MIDEKVIELAGNVRVLEREHETLSKHHDKLFDLLDNIRVDIARLVSIEEKQVAINNGLDRIEAHASKQGKEIQIIKEDQHHFDLRLQSLESSAGVNTDSRMRWDRVMERVIGSAIILAMGAFIALKQGN